MTKNQQTACFERIAFECQLREHPSDKTTALVFADWLQDHGYTPMGAKRFVTRIIREGIEQRQVEEVQQRLATDLVYLEVLHDVLRYHCGIQAANGYHLVIERGGHSPVWLTDTKIGSNAGIRMNPRRPNADPGDELVRFGLVVHTVRVGALWVMHVVGAEQQRRAARPARPARRRA